MKALKQKTILIIIILLSVTIKAQEFNLNPENNTISWTGKAAFNAYELTGSLKATNGTIIIKNDSIVDLTIIVDMKSLSHENGDLKSHLRSKDFFDVKKYTEASFNLIKSAKIKNGVAQIIGEMTIKNITKQEEITISLNIEDNTVNLNLDSKLNRIDYGVTFNSPSIFKKMKENAIADHFKLKGILKLNQ